MRKATLQDLIDALLIFRKYGNPDYPTHCEHDTLLVNVDPKTVSVDDKQTLIELGFFHGEEFDGVFTSFRFGSA